MTSELIHTSEERKEMFFKRSPPHALNNDLLVINEISVNAEADLLIKPKLSFANIKLNYDYFIRSLRGEPLLSSTRYEIFAKLLKQTRLEDANFMLLPECSVPHQLIASFAKFSETNQIVITAGIEHWRVKDICYNFIITILPFDNNGVKDATVVYRLKNHYSHHEAMDVRGNSGIVPKPKPYRYDLINWRGIYFSPYYCVELGDIFHRSLFRSKVDLIIASEWNKDTNYFSSIVESLSRDLHAFVAQVNNSEFGDSRLTQPSQSNSKDILRLKGGVNDTILIGEIDIQQLREFQRQLYELTCNDKNFKPVPPDFKVSDVHVRLNNSRFF